MNKKEITKLLKEKEYSEEQLNNMVHDVYEFEIFLSQNFPGISLLNAGRKETECYSTFLVKNNKNNKERDEDLVHLKNSNKLLYTMAITDEVIDFVKNNMEIGVGKLEGNYIYFTKFPYNPSKYIKEKNIIKKRYYTCHCFWTKKSILHGNSVSSEFCYCSLGHAKRLFDGALGCELQGEILETALKGNIKCRFRFKVPKGIK